MTTPRAPLPDLRFEQSYLTSLSAAHGVWWKIVAITVRDQLLVPLAQGFAYNLAVAGWRAWGVRARRGGRRWGEGVRGVVRRTLKGW